MTDADISANTPTPTPVIRLFTIELWCLACGAQLGVLLTNCWPSFGPFHFQATGADQRLLVGNWTRLRCAAWGGNPYVDGVRSRRVYPHLRPEDFDLPRRGRPPKWLVAQRRAVEQGDTG